MSRVDVRAIRRQQILEAAERLAVDRRWTEITILDICQEAGISSGVVTYHFRNKDEIMFTLLEEFIGRIDAHLNQAARGAQTPQEDICNFLGALTALLEADPHVPVLLIQFVAASLNQPEIAERLHRLFASIRQRKLEEWKATGAASERMHEQAVVLVSMLHIVVLGVLLARPFLGIDLPSARLMQEAERILLAGFPSRERASQTTPN